MILTNHHEELSMESSEPIKTKYFVRNPLEDSTAKPN